MPAAGLLSAMEKGTALSLAKTSLYLHEPKPLRFFFDPLLQPRRNPMGIFNSIVEDGINADETVDEMGKNMQQLTRVWISEGE